SLPDIDIDFCERRRGEVIEYVTRKYGRENVAQIITFGTMKARAVVRDVGRALDMPYADADRVAKQIPAVLDMTLARALAENPALKEMEQSDAKVRELLQVAQRLEGLTRHASVHAAGVVIAPKPLTEFVPLYKGQRDEITTQWGMKEIERVGLLKMDFLGLSTLTLIRDAVEHIRETTGEVVDLDSIPLDDPKTFQVFAEGQTFGIFQFESSGMRDILRKARPQRFDDLIALNALYRPGPLRSGMVDDFIARKQGKVEIKYELPQLEPILRDTYGVIAYQEQVIRIARELGGFTLGEADILRKAMGKKKADVMQAQRHKFVEGAKKSGINERKAARIFDLMEHFAGYGFPKAHSTAYALLAYHTAYLKTNYPRHFMAALLTIESQNTDKLAMYLAECRERAIGVLAPDVNESQLAFTVTPEGVRFGLAAVKNVGESAIQAVIDVRRRLGRLTSLYQVCEEVDLRAVNKRALESLIKAGAMDSVVDGAAGTLAPKRVARARLLASLERACEFGARQQRDRDKGQVGLFGGAGDDASASGNGYGIRLAEAEPWSEAQQLVYEKEALGLYWSGHPIERYTKDLTTFGALKSADLTDIDPGSSKAADIAVGGVIASIRQLKTRKGDRMAVIVLEDQTGSVEVVVFPEAYTRAATVLQADQMVLVKGKVERDEETARLVASDVWPIEALWERLARELAIRIEMPPHDRHTLKALFDLFQQHRGDRRVSFEVELRSLERPVRIRADVASQIRVQPSPKLVAEVERICGSGTAELR
ncbi:MAG: DNA polymerase III subunit alpha, partial [Acidobacteria bacterium]|nr:DNA polymerase III subunit alpha [Acidobacteriota bacterium]